MERSLLVIKPDGVQKNLVGEVLRRVEESGLRIADLKMMKTHRELLDKHYPESMAETLGKKSEAAGDRVDDYFKQGMMVLEGLKTYLMESPVVAAIVEGDEAVKRLRGVVGYTDPASAEKGTIRGELSDDSILEANKEKRSVRNLVHASGSVEEAQKEISLWFMDGVME